MARTIAVGLDLSDLSPTVFDAAVALARDLHAALLLVHAVPFPVVSAEMDAAAAAMVVEGQHEAAKTRAMALATEWGQKARALGLDARVESTFGDPATVVLDAARRAEASVVVVGTHGRKGLRRLALGSVAEQVVRHSDRPVLVVPAPK